MTDIDTKRVTRKLPVKMTDHEIQMRGVEHANASVRRDSIDYDRKSIAKIFTDHLKTADEIVHDLRDQVRSGLERRDVEVEITVDHKRRWVEVTRMDTFEVIEGRPLNASEQQGEFDYDADPASADDHLTRRFSDIIGDDDDLRAAKDIHTGKYSAIGEDDE